MTISFGSSGHSGSESHHYYRQAAAPAAADGLDVGDRWSDTTANAVKRCTSTSPVTFVSIEGGSSAHDLFSATHGDIDDTDTPADDEVLTYDNASAKWRAEPASGHGTHIASGDDHLEAHDLFSAAHTGDLDDTDTPVNKDVLTYDGGAAKWKAESQIGSKSITIEDPTSSEDISAFFTNSAITITEIRAVLVGSSTPSVTWTVRHGTDRSAVGAEAVTGGATTTSTTTGDDVTSFNDATIVADSFVWLETTAKSGTVDELHITVFYTIDP